MGLHFDTRYREQITLQDGSLVVLRLVGPADRELLREGLNRLSPESRYRRFMIRRGELTESELAYLTDLDGESHLAIGAVRQGDDGREEPLGVARFVRLPTDRAVAEPAVAVVDAVHRQGLGTELLRRLAAAARERDIRWFRFEFLEENEPVQHLVDALGSEPMQITRDSPGVLVATVPVPEPRADDRARSRVRGHPAHALLTHAARGDFSARLRLGRLVLKGPGE